MPDSPPKSSSTSKWLHPSKVLQLHRLKAKKKALQARINCPSTSSLEEPKATKNFDGVLTAKRKNPFLKAGDSKRSKTVPLSEDTSTSDQTLFKLLNLSSVPLKADGDAYTSFTNILSKLNEKGSESVQIVKAKGEKWIPIDWSLKTKIRFLSSAPFAFNSKLKISEEASGITGFTRCLENDNTDTTLDTSPNSKFHQCCLYWQQPALPWLTLFPRTNTKSPDVTVNVFNSSKVKDALQAAWRDSFCSLFQLIRTRQCPYFYVCTNTFTVLFRAGGICGFTEMHAIVAPTTRGFRQMLRKEEIEYLMPLKKKQLSDSGCETSDTNADDEPETEEEWLQDMGIDPEDIKQITQTQAKIRHRTECEVDNSEQSTVLIEGMEVHALYNYLINCKSITASTGPMNGVPPTILAPVAFQGATLNSLRVRENKVRVDDEDFYSLELSGPILPSTIHNLCSVNPYSRSFTATFTDVEHTVPFSKVRAEVKNSGDVSSGVVFGHENLKDCGLSSMVLKHFCAANARYICNVECLKYSADTKTFTWT